MPQPQPARDTSTMSLVEQALMRPESERESFLKNACSEDTDLFAEVLRRVRLEEEMGSFLRDPLLSLHDGECPLHPGDLLAGRFRVIREVGRGGMAVVYEAKDEKLENRRIAIKCARPGFLSRLSPEALSATEISHPNICKTYEIHTASGEFGEIEFITMEYLGGETLASRLRRDGPLPPTQVYDLALQLCSGLHAAHERGVVHGDLKGSNIIVAERTPGELMYVITDFGLARRYREERPPSPTDIKGGGTPPYMAPELWRGEPSTVASDLFALGAILYESLCGRSPFPNGTAEGSFDKPLRRWSRFDAKTRRLGRAILRCLDPDPCRRPPSAEAVHRLLLDRGARTFLLTAATLAAAAVALVGDSTSLRLPNDPVRLALLPFQAVRENTTSTNGMLIVADGLLSHVRSSGRTFSALPFSETLQRNIHTPDSARSLLGATHILRGSYEENGDTIVIRAALVDARSMQELRDLRLTYNKSDTSRLPVALAGLVTSTLGLPPVRSAYSIQPAAYSDYIAGLGYLQAYATVDAAIDSFERASTRDPASETICAKLAEAYRRKHLLTKEMRFAELAERALARAESLNPDSAAVRSAAGMLEFDRGQYARAAQDFERAIVLSPFDIDAYWGLARAYEFQGDAQRAMSAYQRAIAIQPTYFQPYKKFGAFFYNRGQFEKAVEQFRRTVSLAPTIAENHVSLAAPYIRMGRYREAEAELRIGLSENETNDALISMGVVLLRENRAAEAVMYLNRAVAAAPNQYLGWLNLADAYLRIGAQVDAASAYEHALGRLREDLMRNPESTETRATLGYVLARLGDRSQADYETSQALARNPADSETALYAVRTYEVLAQRERALSVLENAPAGLIADVENQPDLGEFSRDPRFRKILTTVHN